MKKEDLPSLDEVKGILGKMLMIIIVFVLCFSTFGIFQLTVLERYGWGYKYYEENDSQKALIGITNQKNFLEKTIEEYIEELEDKGCEIVSYVFNTHTFCKPTVIKNNQINEKELKQAIIDNLDVSIFVVKLNIKNDERDYYFTSEEACNNFIEKLDGYTHKSEYSTESKIEDVKVLTPQKVLIEKEYEIRDLSRQQAEKIAAQKRAEEEQKRKVTSRGSTPRAVNSNYKSGYPLASYKFVSSGYGYRNGSYHRGIDIAAVAGTSIYAWKSGKVVSAGWNGGYGNFVEIQHDDGTVSRYAHMSKYAVAAGQYVQKGQTIGYVGSTGNSTGPHLHFEIKINGNFVNPNNYI